MCVKKQKCPEHLVITRRRHRRKSLKKQLAINDEFLDKKRKDSLIDISNKIRNIQLQKENTDISNQLESLNDEKNTLERRDSYLRENKQSRKYSEITKATLGLCIAKDSGDINLPDPIINIIIGYVA